MESVLKKLFSGKIEWPKIEEAVLAFWEKNKIFEKSLAQNKGKKKFIFYEGPPYANGRPGIHHVLARVVKDIILRYKSMLGYFVPRRAGWDTHGLPVEIAAEKSLGLKSKKDIEKFGVALFNKKAREAVWIYKDEWENLTKRIGYWLDLKNAYVTYENDYIETIWWTLKRIWEKKLLFKGHRVVPWCPRCETALSSHEVAQGYREITENSVYLKFKLVNEEAFILSWTTTPWTLPGNTALAVNPNLDYVKIQTENKEFLILAKARLLAVSEKYKIIKEIKGKKLYGLSYEPIFKIPSLKNNASHKIYTADFVTAEEGTGVVHIAPMYGEDDYELAKKVGLPLIHVVDENGKFTAEVNDFKGLDCKEKETEEKIFSYLEKNKILYKVEPYSHEYPFCWRCQNALIYYARHSWFIAMSK